MYSQVRRVGDDVIVALGGDADLAAAPQLTQVLQRAISTASGSAGTVVVDLDGVLVLDDTALGLLVGAAASARRADLDVAVICSDNRMRERLAETRLDQIIEVRSGTD